MSTTQAIPNQRLTGTQTFQFTAVPSGSQWAEVDIDRTVAGGLNSLTGADTLEIDVARSSDGGTTWQPVAGVTLIGGTYVTKGVTQSTDEITIGIDPGQIFQVKTTASTPVRVTGQVVYYP